MPKQTEYKVKQERSRRMLELSRSSRWRFCEHFLGQIMPVLWEQETKPGSGTYSGLTGNYIRVFAHSAESLSNEITLAKLLDFRNQGIWGEMADENPG